MTSKPLLVQCDFDGTLTIGDVSFLILDEFTGDVWRRELDEYMRGEITVNRFNARAFSRVKADLKTLQDFARRKAVIRPGLPELLRVCREKDYRFVIVSNGMAFYIQAILDMLCLSELEYIAGQAEFLPGGMRAWYPGPDGSPLEDGFKEAWTAHFLAQGYRVVYIGNGTSDFAPARRCSHIFAVDNLLAECRKAGVGHTAFEDLGEVAQALEKM
jgi:2-hydroxy-3-keto-5-methylthiopentenyl-1-phosphate phosphatase